MGIAHMPGDALDVGIALDEVLEYLVLGFVAGLQGNAVLPVALRMVVFILPQVVGLDAQQDINVRQAQGAVIPCFLPGPELGTEIAVKAGGEA